MSKLDLIAFVLEEGLPSRVERECIRREKLAADDEGTTPPSSPPAGD
jgi:hypothetical protein